jgi:hypothetical protein
VVVVLGANAPLGASVSDVCLEWFAKAKIVPDEKCEWKCASTRVNMGTFDCGAFCDELCRLAKNRVTVTSAPGYMPYLNSEEVKLVAKYPKQSWVVYQQKLLSEAATNRRFGRNDPDDESDAFRHFVWAALLARELGPDLAKTFLDAHEATEDTGSAARAMDLANNRAGLLAAEMLRKKNILSDSEIEREAMLALKKKTLVVISPKGD